MWAGTLGADLMLRGSMEKLEPTKSPSKIKNRHFEIRTEKWPFWWRLQIFPDYPLDAIFSFKFWMKSGPILNENCKISTKIAPKFRRVRRSWKTGTNFVSSPKRVSFQPFLVFWWTLGADLSYVEPAIRRYCGAPVLPLKLLGAEEFCVKILTSGTNGPVKANNCPTLMDLWKPSKLPRYVVLKASYGP